MKYEDLPLIPSLIAQCVAERTYQGEEFAARHPIYIAEIEAARQKMTPAQIEEFVQLSDDRCRAAYQAKRQWFIKCLKGNQGRDQLYLWASHWLAGFLIERCKRGEIKVQT